MQEITRASGVRLRLLDDVTIADVAHIAGAGGVEAPVSRGRGRGGLPTGPIPMSSGVPAPGTDGADPVVASLQAQGLTVVDAFEVAAPGAASDSMRRRGPGVAEEGEGQIAVQIDASEDAVLLLEQDGVYSWHYPAAEKTEVQPATRRGPIVVPASKVVVFDVPLAPAAPEAGRQRGMRGPVGDFIRGTVRTYVLKFIARVAVGQVMKFMERNTRRGLVVMDSSDPARWRPVDDLSAVSLPRDRPARVLLFVHGTFSSTLGSFGALGAADGGRDFLDAARRNYDLVVGFDHATLSDDPLENATDLLGRLERGQPAFPPVIDAISYSRGALVLRSLIEYLLPASPFGAHVRRAVFVGGTNGGTQLAETANWKRLADLYTNLAVAGCKAVGFLAPGSQVPALILSESLQTLGALVKYLTVAALDEKGIPGLAAMSPRGDFVTQINTAQPGQPSAADSFYCVITSEFDVTLLPRDGGAGGLPQRFVQWLLDGLADGLMREPNDLVVNTAAMSQIDAASGVFVKDRFDFGRNPNVYHTVYFTQPKLVDALGRWLQTDAPAADARPALRRAPAAAEAGLGMSYDVPSDRSTRGLQSNHGLTYESTVDGEPPPPPDMAPDMPLAVAPGPAPAPPTRDRFYFAASMPESVAETKTADVLVAISRDVLEIVESAVSGAAYAEVLLTRTLIVQLVAKQNLEVVGDDRVELNPAELARKTDLVFEVKGTDAGPGEVWVLFRQGPVVLATLRLKPQVTGSGAQVPRGRIDSTVDVTPEPPVAVSYPVLQIFERRNGDQITYQFVLEKGDGSFRNSDSKPLRGNREDYIAALYKQIENRWVSVNKDAEAFEREMQAYGGQLLDELVPVDVQYDLWELRDQLHAIHVLSEEPFIPWEIVHLKQPPQPGGNPPPLSGAPQFLAQKGLVRWLHNQGAAARELRIRAGRAYYVIPNYPDQRYKLPAAQAEIPFLVDRLHAKPLEAESNAIRNLLAQSGAVDLFHFSGHGEADSSNVSQARILLLGRVEGTSYIPLDLNSTLVQQWAALRESRPLVILNACQVGRVGWQLTSIGGFAEAFIRQGAGAFVGALWSVGDKPARTFTEGLYTALLNGQTIAEAACAGRDAARGAGEATWLAYVVYGHPLAKLRLET